MDRKRTYSLWLRPFGDVAYSLQERIRKLSEKYDTPIFEPHVTLLGGLDLSKTELVQLTGTLAGSLHPFEIVLTRAGYMDSYYQALFAHVVKSNDLAYARKTAEQLFNKKTEEKYVPHLSLMYGDFTKEQKERILNVMGREFHIRFPVHNVLLVDTTGKPAEWKKIHSSEFKR